MVLPPAAQQVIDQIIVATDDTVPDLREPMRSELTAQLESLFISEILATLPIDKKPQLHRLLEGDPASPYNIDSFIVQNAPHLDQSMEKAIDKLKVLYLD